MDVPARFITNPETVNYETSYGTTVRYIRKNKKLNPDFMNFVSKYHMDNDCSMNTLRKKFAINYYVAKRCIST